MTPKSRFRGMGHTSVLDWLVRLKHPKPFKEGWGISWGGEGSGAEHQQRALQPDCMEAATRALLYGLRLPQPPALPTRLVLEQIHELAGPSIACILTTDMF